MECLHPIMLKSGVLVPCGQCTLCQSAKRTEKSLLVQMHCEYFPNMPLFIGLSYDPENLPLYCTCSTSDRLDHAPAWSEARFYNRQSVDELNLSCTVPSLHRRDVSSFLKHYKRVCGLTNDKFQYFGCGEYGDQYDRPHYHLIWFGDENLEKLYQSDVHSAERWLAEFWQKGHVDINVAEWSGIHYVTKYCLKDDQHFPDGAVPPFTISSNGLGLPWLKSDQAERIRQQLMYVQFNKDKIYSHIDLSCLDWKDHNHRIDQLKEMVEFLRPQMPDFKIILPSGNKGFLPRKLKRLLLGSFQHFKDSPIWLYSELQAWLETELYLRDNHQFDETNERSYGLQQMESHAYAINLRINRNKKRYV